MQSFDYNVTEYYQRPEDLIFLLQHTPIIPNFGMEPEDYSRLTAFIENNRTKKGIYTNSKRFLIIAKK
ncbi:methyltransferase, putative [Planococcus donghaensis MPA1U2]|uniref:Methyltransferase, putative n=1 Tax=Planococcus donghaensis MPA1U2 TaxID=933115 RepID=E7RDB2_9BACL|nr:methyltransferase, putative [Planococcus donghaensis MPA1U2]